MAGKVRLADLCESIVDCPHSTPAWTESGVVVLRNQNIRTGRLDLSEPSYTDEDHYLDRIRRAAPTEGDLVITREAPMGEVCMIPPGLRCCLGQRMVLLRPDRRQIEPRYLLYALQSKEVQHEIGVNEGTGSTVSNLRIPLLEALPIPMRPLSEQRAIAHILGTLDDKIELNRRMSETLEAMARALFKSWFVDFEPVRAKAEGRDSGLPKALTDLFPDSFEDSQLGGIPKGWRLSRLGGEVETLLGGTPARNEPTYWGGDIPWINSGRVNEFRVVEASDFITREGLEASAAKLLPLRTTVIAITGATLGQVSLTEITTCANQSVVGVLGTDVAPSEYLYLWVREHIYRLVANRTGAAQQHINKNNVNELPLLCPRDRVVRAFVAAVRPAFDRIRTSCLEQRTLAALRDSLLPRFISGAMRVAGAEQVKGASR